jgi:predicted amidohydrolase
VFVPHFVTTDDGSLPGEWCAATSPYNEKALLCRALENTVYIAAADIGGPDQGSITGIIGPNGSLIASLEYGAIGVAWTDIDLDLADAAMARRWEPDRSVVGADGINGSKGAAPGIVLAGAQTGDGADRGEGP